MASQTTYAGPVSVDAGAPLAEAGLLMTSFRLPSVFVLRSGANAGTLSYCDVLRGLRRARGGQSVSAAMSDPNDAADPPPSAEAAADPPGIEDHAGVFEPDLLLGSQYRDRLRRSAEFEPERRLMVAVLEQGVNDYVKHLAPRDALEAELWREAERWVEDRDATWLYSFEHICDVLGIEAEWLRRGLHAARERARGPRPEKARDVAAESDEERVRATSG